jgi:hypothetical protein
MIVVVVILGIVYGLAMSKVSQNTSTLQTKPTLHNIYKYLTNIEYKYSISLKCLPDKDKCYIFVDGLYKDSIEYLLRDDDVAMMIADDIAREVEFFPLLDDGIREDVSLQIDIDRHGGTKELLVVSKDRAIYLGGYLKEAREYKDIDEYIAYKDELLQKVNR